MAWGTLVGLLHVDLPAGFRGVIFLLYVALWVRAEAALGQL